MRLRIASYGLWMASTGQVLELLCTSATSYSIPVLKSPECCHPVRLAYYHHCQYHYLHCHHLLAW